MPKHSHGTRGRTATEVTDDHSDEEVDVSIDSVQDKLPRLVEEYAPSPMSVENGAVAVKHAVKKEKVLVPVPVLAPRAIG